MNNPPRIAYSPKEIKCLTGLRFLLSTWVVFGHQAGQGGLLEPLATTPFFHILHENTLAVSGFFCLSGFILAYNYSTRLGSLDEIAHFLGARLARIYPVYLLGLLVFLPYAIHNWHEEIFSPAETIGALTFSLLLLQSVFPPYCVVWNAPSWSLSAEFFFYASLPLYAARLQCASNRRLGVAFAACLLASFGCWLLGQALGAGVYAVYNPLSRVPEFAAGYLAGLYYLRRGAWSVPTSTAAVLLAALVIVVGCDYLPTANYFGIFPLFFVLLIYGLVNPPRLVGWLLGNPFALLLGEVSYAIYLLHLPGSLYFKSFEKYVSRTDVWHRAPYLAMGLYFLSVVLVSTLVFFAIERPLRKRLAPVLAGRMKKSLARFY